MHAVNWPILGLPREEFLTSDCTGHDIAHQWVTFWQVGGKIHFFPKITTSSIKPQKNHLPLVFLLDAQAGESKVRSNAVGSYEVHLAV